MIKKTLIFLLILSTPFMHAQEKCGTEANTLKLIEKYPDYAKAREKVNAEIKNWIENHPDYQTKTIITIPVVVHVVWKTDAQNIPDTQIQSQIDVLNNDFRRTNIDVINTPTVWQGVAADCEIEFCLATTDPNGNPTSGITRTETTTNQFDENGNFSVQDASSGGKEPWDVDNYLNIWVCNLGAQGSGLLGYASKPSSSISSNDGVVVGYWNFGLSGNSPYHKGRTATHEVGHWLNLIHIWGDNNCGDDEVTDTPKQETDNTGCPGYPHNANSCNITNSDGDMFMNYMDYTNDACMNLFTNGQKAIMLAAINLYRPNLIQNTCSNPTNLINKSSTNKKLVKTIDILGRETNKTHTNTPLFYIYDDGTVEKKIIIE